MLEIELIGLTAGALTSFAGLPQIYKIWKYRETKGISRMLWVMMTAGALMWLVYGLGIGSISLILWDTFSVVINGSVLYILMTCDIRKAKNA